MIKNREKNIKFYCLSCILSLKMLFFFLFLYKTDINTPKMQFFFLFLYKTDINTPKMQFFFLFLY